jgi:hypothetical protein
MNFKRTFTPLALVLAAAAPLLAQETVGTIVGNVTDRTTGKPLAGVKLQLHSAKMLGERMAVTGADGAYRIALLPYGEYTLATNAPGFNNSNVHFTVTPGQTTRQNIKLAAIQAVIVEVIADAASQIDKTETSVQTMFPMEAITNITGGDLKRILDIAPAVVSDKTDKGGTLTVRGGNTTGARFLVNGIDASDPGWGVFDPTRMLITDMVETVAVIASPLNARYGNTESGMLSYVTTRGSNEFKGSIRATYSVNGTYGNSPQPSRATPRFGTDDDPHIRRPLDGAAARNWEASVSGPIWKDHITFAWGGRFYPNTTNRKMVDRTWNPDGGNWATSQGGTVYPLPGGAQIRKANTYDMGKYYDKTDSTTFNQYALFWQINTQHSLDWSYSEYKEDLTDLYANSVDIHSANYNNVKDSNRIWNLAYKGLIANGVLEARIGRTSYDVVRPDTSASQYTNISVTTVPTWANSNFTTGSGKPYATLGSYGSSAYGIYPYTNLFQARALGPYQTSFTVNGSPYDKGETKSNTSMFVNYQLPIGEHLVDMGVNHVKTHWDTSIGDSDTKVYGTGGQISPDLANSDILYPAGYAGTHYNAADYAGKWVVWDAHASTLGLYPGYPDPTDGIRQYATGTFGAPTMVKYYGQEGGGFDEITDSLYLNDVWQASNKFTFMGGLRYDKFKLEDTSGTVLSYGILSPRFEVKYDLAGDQRRVLSYSWAKFHNRMPSAAFLALVHRRKPYSITEQWDTGAMGVDASGNPMKGGYRLVTTADLLNPANYTYYTAQNNPDIYKLDPNFKADFNVEQTLNFNRAYENGSNIRASLVYRKWFNNYQWFQDPHASYITNPYAPVSSTTPAKDLDPTWTTHRVLRNDSGLFHTYHSFEMEWNFVLAKRLNFSGNYTYSRNYSNQMYYAAQSNYSEDNVGVRHAPWGINLPDVWKLVGLSMDDIAQKDVNRNQIANAWFTYDLSTGDLKQSLILRGKWVLGKTWTAFWWPTTIDAHSDAWKAILAKNNVGPDFPTALNISQNYGNAMYVTYPGTHIGDWKDPDSIEFHLKYNLDVPIAEKLHWTIGVEVFNLFNRAYSRNQIDYQWSDISGSTGRSGEFRVDGSRTGAVPAANGYRTPGSAMFKPGLDFVDGGRYVQFETGIRF